VATNDGALTSTSTVGITVTAVADIVADTVTTLEDTAISFNPISGANETSGADSFENAARFISAINGSAITAGGAGVAVTGGTITLALDGSTLTFTPTANYNGAPVISYTVSSGGVTETANITLNVTAVNDAPSNTVPAAQTTAEDTPLSIGGVSVADIDSTNLSTTVSVAHGTLGVSAFAGASITNNGTGSVTIAGTAAAINGALAGLAYSNTADYNGADTLTVATNDGALTSTSTVGITVTAVADIVADTVTTLEDTAISFNPISGANETSGADSFENAGRFISAINGSAITAGGGGGCGHRRHGHAGPRRQHAHLSRRRRTTTAPR